MGRKVPPWRGRCKCRCRSSNLRLKRALPRASSWGNCSKPDPRTVQLVGSTGRGKERGGAVTSPRGAVSGMGGRRGAAPSGGARQRRLGGWRKRRGPRTPLGTRGSAVGRGRRPPRQRWRGGGGGGTWALPVREEEWRRRRDQGRWPRCIFFFCSAEREGLRYYDLRHNSPFSIWW